jgi:hypothetical protein
VLVDDRIEAERVWFASNGAFLAAADFECLQKGSIAWEFEVFADWAHGPNVTISAQKGGLFGLILFFNQFKSHLRCSG